MIIGQVIGNVWATRKHEDLSGAKFMIVEPRAFEGHRQPYPVVAVDLIGAGVGETVLVVSGSSARLSVGSGNKPIDHVIVGIVDQVDLPTGGAAATD
jgi:ethanolamine utilization protein EutN